MRGLDGVSEADGLVRTLAMNSIGWMVGHMANQEHRNWVAQAAAPAQRHEANAQCRVVGRQRSASTSNRRLSLREDRRHAADLLAEPEPAFDWMADGLVPAAGVVLLAAYE